MNKKSNASLGVTFILLGVLLAVFVAIIWVNISLNTQFGQDFVKEYTPILAKVNYFFSNLISKIFNR